MKMEVQSPGFVYCEECRTLFVGLVALRFSHVCGNPKAKLSQVGPEPGNYGINEFGRHLKEHDVTYPAVLKVVGYGSQEAQTLDWRRAKL